MTDCLKYNNVSMSNIIAHFAGKAKTYKMKGVRILASVCRNPQCARAPKAAASIPSTRSCFIISNNHY